LSWIEFEVELIQFNRPLDDAPSSVMATQDLSKGARDDLDLVCLEVVPELARSDEEGVQHFLGLRVSDLAIGEDLVDIVDMSLDGVALAFLSSRCHQDCADHLGERGVVKEQGLLWCRGHYDWGRHEEGLQLFQGLVRHIRPYELISLF
jgi:hypothetical protein